MAVVESTTTMAAASKLPMLLCQIKKQRKYKLGKGKVSPPSY